MLTLDEHTSASYGPRTFHNATLSHLTARFAIDFETAGEKLTAKAAAGVVVDIPVTMDRIDGSRKLYRSLNALDAQVLNVAGNGIYTFAKHEYTQEWVNQFVFDVIAQCHHFWPLSCIRSGGQTGADIAGAVAAVRLQIPAIITFPKGFKQRDANKVDADHTVQELEEQINAWAKQLV